MNSSVKEAVVNAKVAIENLRMQAYIEGFEKGRDFERCAEVGTTPARGFLKESRRETPQEKRDRIVEQAKADVEKLTSDCSRFTSFFNEKGGNSTYRNYTTNVEFIVNKEKRTTVALVHNICPKKLLEKGIAKCAPSDCFNVHIGRAIALRRALGLEVPDEYLFTPQPTEVREGDVVVSTKDWPKAMDGPFYKGDIFEVRESGCDKYVCDVGSAITENCIIIDDSREDETS